MAAMLIPADVYLDTSVVIAAINVGDAYYQQCTVYCSDLAQRNSSVYFSQLLRLEFAQFIRKVATDKSYALPLQTFQQYQLQDYGTNMMVRHNWTHYVAGQFDALIRTFYRVYELPIQKRIITRSRDLMALYGIESYDAAHVATAIKESIPVLATTDGKFNRVTSGPMIHLIR